MQQKRVVVYGRDFAVRAFYYANKQEESDFESRGPTGKTGTNLEVQ